MTTEGELTALAARLLEVIQAADGWMSRAQIAIAIGRKRNTLTVYDAHHLDTLVNRGLIEKREAIRGAVMKRWEYRSKQTG